MLDPTTHDSEAEIRAALDAFRRDGVEQGAGAIDRFMAHMAEDFTGFGTGRGDFYPSRAAFRAVIEREQAGMPHPTAVEISWMEVRVLRPTTALAEGEMRVEVHAPQQTHTMAFRCSFVFERRGERWLIVHSHYSVPDVAQDEGDTLMEVLEARNRALEREVARRTAELEQSLADLRAAQARLVQQEKMASLGALTAGVAHEIKNPLNFINNFAALTRELAEDLATETDPEEIRTLLADLRVNAGKIEAHGRRADGIVRAMLEHASGGGSERRAVDLNALVSEYVDLARHARQARSADFDVEVTTTLDPAVGHVDAAPQDIGRVLVNLLGNAFDAVAERQRVHRRGSADEGPSAETETYAPTVTVATRRTEGEVEIRVTDNGAGVADAVRDKIFEPFFTTKPAGSGVGLGLSLSYDIVTQGHGGTLALETTPGEGATFVVTLPAAGG